MSTKIYKITTILLHSIICEKYKFRQKIFFENMEIRKLLKELKSKRF